MRGLGNPRRFVLSDSCQWNDCRSFDLTLWAVVDKYHTIYEDVRHG
jgi:hypothetical protein